MNIKTFLLVGLVLVAHQTALVQTVVLPWHVVDNGGGASVSGQTSLQSSVGQPAVTEMSSNGITLESGFIPGLRIISGTSSALDVAIQNGWNMISVPLVVSDFRKSVLYPSGTTKAYNYHNGYSTYDTLRNGLAYWIKFGGTGTSHFTGSSIARDTIILHDGWNMVGCLSYALPTSDLQQLDSTTIITPYWSYSSGFGYSTEDTLNPGKGYWIKVRNSGRFVLKSGSVVNDPAMSFAPEKKSPQMKGIDLAKDVSTLIVRDASGNERKLYIASSGASLDLEKWEMPPIPFEGMMDVRYATNRMMEVGEASKEKVVGINISSVEYPITISWKMAGEMKQEHLRVENEEVELRGNGEKRISNPDSRVSLRLSASSEKELPKTFALYQNYPNPFNPSTTIRYDLPVKSTVSMRIYNLLGEEVRTLVDEVEDAGFRSFEWDASSYASGVYFYRIEAREVEGSLHLVDVKKLVLVK